MGAKKKQPVRKVAKQKQDTAGEVITVRVESEAATPEAVLGNPVQPEEAAMQEAPEEPAPEAEEQADFDDEPVAPARARRRLVRLGVSVFVLFVLLCGGGVAYTWYMDGQGGSQPVAAKSTSSNDLVPSAPSPRMPAADAQEGVAVASFTTPVAPGSNASMQVNTNATSTCTISVTYNGAASQDSGLSPKVADDYGNVSWSWTVGSNVPYGKYPVKVTCTYHGKSAVIQNDLQVAKS